MPGNSYKVTDHFHHSVLAVPLALCCAGISQEKHLKALKTACWAQFMLLIESWMSTQTKEMSFYKSTLMLITTKMYFTVTKQWASDYPEEISCRNKKWFISQFLINLNTANWWHMGRLTEKQEGWARAGIYDDLFFILMTTLTEVLTEALTFWFPSYRPLVCSLDLLICPLTLYV